MTTSAWLLTIKEQQPSLEHGRDWRFWTEPQRDRASGQVRRRGDGAPYTPQWRTGEDVFIYHPDSKRIIARLTLDGLPDFDEAHQRFYIDSTIEDYDPNGPTLSDIKVEAAVQGGRQRLTPAQHGAAVRGLRAT